MSSRRHSAWQRFRGWPVLVLVTTGVVAAVVVVLLVSRGSSGGAPTREEAVASYVDAVNRRDAEALRRISGNDGPALTAGVRRRLDAYGGREIRLTGSEILDGATPDHSYAVLSGSMTGAGAGRQDYRERLYLRDEDGRWYVDLREPLSPTDSRPLAPANTVPSTG
ncbi:hypothetical protein [Lentzea sp.]|uniref:hypothetical protein n=1 Tax=Lentzea sp. TaxID=56099 RepID=UPI002ED40774